MPFGGLLQRNIALLAEIPRVNLMVAFLCTNLKALWCSDCVFLFTSSVITKLFSCFRLCLYFFLLFWSILQDLWLFGLPWILQKLIYLFYYAVLDVSQCQKQFKAIVVTSKAIAVNAESATQIIILCISIC